MSEYWQKGQDITRMTLIAQRANLKDLYARFAASCDSFTDDNSGGPDSILNKACQYAHHLKYVWES